MLKVACPPTCVVSVVGFRWGIFCEAFPTPGRPLPAVVLCVCYAVLLCRLTQLLVTRIQHELVPMKADVETALARSATHFARAFVFCRKKKWAE